MTQLKLVKSARMENDKEYADFLEELAVDSPNNLIRHNGNILFPSYIKSETEEKKAIDWLYGDELKTPERTGIRHLQCCMC